MSERRTLNLSHKISDYGIDTDSGEAEQISESDISLDPKKSSYYDAEKEIDINIKLDNSEMENELEAEFKPSVDESEIDLTSETYEEKHLTLMKKNYAYPEQSDPHIQYYLYPKREFYANKIPERPDVNDYNDIKEYRDNICARSFTLHEHQALLSNYINPDTPYRGILIFHGLGTGKCITASQFVNINGTIRKVSTIWEDYKTNIIKDNENGEWSEPKNELIVNSIDASGKIVQKQVKRLYKEKINSYIRKITLENGYEVKITDIHQLNKEDGWSNELHVNDYIAIPKRLYNCQHKNKLDVSSSLAYLLGYQLSAETKDQRSGNLHFYIHDDNTFETLKRSIEEINLKYNLDIDISSKSKNRRNKKGYEINTSSINYIEFLRMNGYDYFSDNFSLNEDIYIPDFIMNTSVENIRIFVNAYLNGRTIFGSFSELFIKQFDVLCKICEMQNIQFVKKMRQNICNKSILVPYYEATFINNLRVDATKEVYWVKIKNIEYERYNDYVYDLEIEDTHNYVSEGVLCHNTCAGIAIAEKFKSMVQKYNTKIYILVSGPLLKENWKNHLLKCTGETYLKYIDKSVYMDKAEEEKLKKNALNQALQYYRFMSYRSFYKRVLGEKIVEKKVVKGAKTHVSYRKTDEGEFERDIAVDRLYNLNNTVILIDEAHNLTGNAYGDALSHIIKNSTNLRVVLLSGTPMKNLADDIIPLLNFIRPPNNPIEREKVYDSNKNHLMEFKDGGIEYLKNMARGYVSHVRGADPLIFAKRVDKGVKPDELTFLKLIRCKMLPFQQRIYDGAVREKEDTLDRKSEAVANFVFPGLSEDRQSIHGYYGREGINTVKNQLKTSHDIINEKLSKLLKLPEKQNDLLYITDDGKTITGKILQYKYLKLFSIKFYKALKKISRLIIGKKGPRIAFIYSNLVKVGIELFEQILLQNGYLEYQESEQYQLSPETICYYCGKPYKEHEQSLYRIQSRNEQNIETETETETDTDNNDNNDSIEYADIESESDSTSVSSISDIANESDFDNQYVQKSESSTDYEGYQKPQKKFIIPKHTFHPATYVSVTGKSGDDSMEIIPEDKKRILDNVYNSLENKEGKRCKFVLGSKVMNEGLSLSNVSEVHVLDVYFNLGKVDQVVGRAIRWCSHYKLMNAENQFPFVNVYKYVVSLQNGLSTEEELYQKAEQKYLLIKKTERALKEIAIDCPLNLYGNMFKEEIEKYKNCGEPGQVPCPTICDYQKCDYKCDDSKLDLEYYDPERKIYKKISKNKLDYSTFTHTLARNEIDYAKSKIKELYMKKYEYSLNSILNYVRRSYDDERRDLFDEFFVHKALDELIPITENDFISFKDTIIDKYSRPGYLIYVGNHYIFQPLDQNEDVPMYYRTTFDRTVGQKLSLYNYLKNTIKYQEYKGAKKKERR